MASSNRLSHDLMYVIRFHGKFKQIVSCSYVCNKVSWQAQTDFLFFLCFAIIHSLEQRRKMHIVGVSHSPRKDKNLRKEETMICSRTFQREMVISGIWTHVRWKETYLALKLLGAYIYIRKRSHWLRLMVCLRFLFIIFTL